MDQELGLRIHARPTGLPAALAPQVPGEVLDQGGQYSEIQGLLQGRFPTQALGVARGADGTVIATGRVGVYPQTVRPQCLLKRARTDFQELADSLRAEFRQRRRGLCADACSTASCRSLCWLGLRSLRWGWCES